jgi:hypothetical protein
MERWEAAVTPIVRFYANPPWPAANDFDGTFYESEVIEALADLVDPGSDWYR